VTLRLVPRSDTNRLTARDRRDVLIAMFGGAAGAAVITWLVVK